MDAKATIFPENKHARLAQLGLRESLLLQAVGEGFLARTNCTAHHPASFPGLAAWADTVRSLRDQLVLEGWVAADEGGIALVRNEAGDIAITVVLGDDGTGDEKKNVSTKRGRGPTFFQQIRVNKGQLSLFPDSPTPVANASRLKRENWMLLHRVDERARVVRCELSLPINVGEDARPDEWRERIVLNPIPFDGDGLAFHEDSDLLGPEIDIRVEKRA